MTDDHKKAFEEAFLRHSDELFRHATLRLSSRERAIELTQESFLKAWEYIRRGEEVRQYRSFLYRILNNLIIDEYRRNRTQSLDMLLENEHTQGAVEGALLRDDADDLEAAMLRHEAAQALECLQTLPAPYRDTLVLRYIDGFTIGEIAEQLGDSPNAVSVRIHRGLAKLHELLENHEK